MDTGQNHLTQKLQTLRNSKSEANSPFAISTYCHHSSSTPRLQMVHTINWIEWNESKTFLLRKKERKCSNFPIKLKGLVLGMPITRERRMVLAPEMNIVAKVKNRWWRFHPDCTPTMRDRRMTTTSRLMGQSGSPLILLLYLLLIAADIGERHFSSYS